MATRLGKKKELRGGKEKGIHLRGKGEENSSKRKKENVRKMRKEGTEVNRRKKGA